MVKKKAFLKKKKKMKKKKNGNKKLDFKLNQRYNLLSCLDERAISQL